MQSGCAGFRRVGRRDLLRVGGAGLLGMSLPSFCAARERALLTGGSPKAKAMILIWLNGGPPHQDMFDMKPQTPPPFGSEFKPIATNTVGIEFCELMPDLAKVTDKFSILRSVSIGNEKWEHSGGLYWMTGNPRTKGTEKHPMFGSVVSKARPAAKGLPTFVGLGPYRDSGDLRENFLGPAHDPLVFEPGNPKDEIGQMLLPPAQLDLPALEQRESLLRSVDNQLRRLDAATPLITGLETFQQGAFDLLRSPALRDAIDARRFAPADLERYGKDADGMMMLCARRLVEAGTPFVFVPFAPGWDFHGSVTNSCKSKVPKLDKALATLLRDLDDRGLLASTIVTVLGEMGRGPIWKDPAYSGPPGRNHWATTQFVLVAGGGFKHGMVLGKTDERAQYVTDDWYSPISFGRTLYHLLGIDPDAELFTAGGRPVKIITDDAPLIHSILA